MHKVILRYLGSDYEGWESEYNGYSTIDSCAEVYYHPEPKETDGEIDASYFSGERGEHDLSKGWIEHDTCYNGFEAPKGIIHVHIEH